MQADLNQLRLLIYIDADMQKHSYISYHSFPILAVKQSSKFNELAKAIENDKNTVKQVVRDRDGNAIAACLLGTADQVNAFTQQRYISLWTSELPEDMSCLNSLRAERGSM